MFSEKVSKVRVDGKRSCPEFYKVKLCSFLAVGQFKIYIFVSFAIPPPKCRVGLTNKGISLKE
jgi:hypothetical protein